MYSDLEWELIKNYSSFVFKSNGLRLTREPFNLNGRYKKKYCGLVQRKAVNVSKPNPETLDLTITIKKNDGRKIKGMFEQYTITKANQRTRRTLKKVGHIVQNLRLHPRFTKDALKNTSNLLRDHSIRPKFSKVQKAKSGEYVINN